MYYKSEWKPVDTCSVGSNYDDKEVIFRGKYQIYSIYNEEGFGELRQFRACAGHFLQVNIISTHNIVRSQRSGQGKRKV